MRREPDGAHRLTELFDRYGLPAVEECFDAIVAGTTAIYRREILSRIQAGTSTWEDYAEHDGVDPPKLHVQRITLARTPDTEPGDPRLIFDFAGTGPQARGSINHCANYADGNLLAKWLVPVPHNLAESPERMAELDVNEWWQACVARSSSSRSSSAPGTSWNGPAPEAIPARVTRPPGTAAAASAPGPPPDMPSVANRATPSPSATACASAATDASPNGAGFRLDNGLR